MANKDLKTAAKLGFRSVSEMNKACGMKTQIAASASASKPATPTNS